jgi:hypothetical protein
VGSISNHHGKEKTRLKKQLISLQKQSQENPPPPKKKIKKVKKNQIIDRFTYNPENHKQKVIRNQRQKLQSSPTSKPQVWLLHH